MSKVERNYHKIPNLRTVLTLYPFKGPFYGSVLAENLLYFFYGGRRFLLDGTGLEINGSQLAKV